LRPTRRQTASSAALAAVQKRPTTLLCVSALFNRRAFALPSKILAPAQLLMRAHSVVIGMSGIEHSASVRERREQGLKTNHGPAAATPRSSLLPPLTRAPRTRQANRHAWSAHATHFDVAGVISRERVERGNPTRTSTLEPRSGFPLCASLGGNDDGWGSTNRGTYALPRGAAACIVTPAVTRCR